MSESKVHERRHNFRGIAQPGQQIQLKYRRKDSTEEVSSAVTRNIGIGGAFISGDIEHPVGTILELTICFPGTPDSVVIDAEIKRTVKGERATRGVGVEFTNITANSRLALSDYFASLRKGEK
jgi:hypothetical protein